VSETVAAAETAFVAGGGDATPAQLRQLDRTGLSEQAGTRHDSVLAALTGREREVALAVIHGASNRMIAQDSNTSVRTVETQLSSIYRKLGVTSRHQLTALLTEDS